jgi:hypothetical protein
VHVTSNVKIRLTTTALNIIIRVKSFEFSCDIILYYIIQHVHSFITINQQQNYGTQFIHKHAGAIFWQCSHAV